MLFRASGILAVGALVTAWALVAPAHALTMQECSAKYKAAQSAGTLKGMKWNDFRKSECAAGAAAAAPATPAEPKSPRSSARESGAGAFARMGNATFPTAISSKYTSESQGKARMHTCLDQYNVNKTSNANGGLKWIQKGGGYYSECNKRLSAR